MTSKNISLNTFLSDLAILNIKLHNLHWNVIGSDFTALHKFTQKMYNLINEQFDEVAELMKMQHETPIATMATYLQNTTITELESRDYPPYEVLEELDTDLQILIGNAKKIREHASDSDNFLVANLMEDYLAVYTKKAWMIHAMLKEDEMPFDTHTDNDDDDDD